MTPRCRGTLYLMNRCRLSILSHRRQGISIRLDSRGSVISETAAVLALASWIMHAVGLILDRANNLWVHIIGVTTCYIPSILHKLSWGINLLFRAFISYPLLVQFNEVAWCLMEISLLLCLNTFYMPGDFNDILWAILIILLSNRNTFLLLTTPKPSRSISNLLHCLLLWQENIRFFVHIWLSWDGGSVSIFRDLPEGALFGVHKILWLLLCWWCGRRRSHI